VARHGRLFAVSKGAIKMLTQTLAGELAPLDGMRVNALAPGVIETPMS
jgi:NAD(P)-dependent dehydrogenase (short-subunit alcohol dehydrogenase family)